MKRKFVAQLVSMLIVLFASILTNHSQAHIDGISKNRLDVFALADNKYKIFWRSSAFDLDFQLPDDCKQSSSPEVWQCQHSLNGRKITIPSLSTYETEAVIRIQHSDQNVQVEYLSGRNNQTEFKSQNKSFFHMAKTYLVLGIEHILLGIDHLLFVFGLILIISGWRALIICITSFTVAHSITLALSTFDIIAIPIAPTEAVIALSIVLLAAEYGKKIRNERSFISAHPVIIGFGIGLVHGLGFASVLKEIGLPSGQYLLSLLSFNLGVEVGQILFIAVTLGLIRLLSPLVSGQQKAVQLISMYALGGIAAYWFAERTAAIVLG